MARKCVSVVRSHRTEGSERQKKIGIGGRNESHFSRRPSWEAPNSVRDSCNSQPIARTERLSRPTVRIAECTHALTHPDNSLQTPLVQPLMRLRHLVLQCNQARLVEEEWSNQQHQETLFVMQGVRIPPPIRPKVHPSGPAASLAPTGVTGRSVRRYGSVRWSWAT